ncbi:MAG: hypothetical protein RSE57_06040 [Clostridia bacterium]
MDTVENAVVDKITGICNNYANKEDLVKISKQKIREKNENISYNQELENIKTKISNVTSSIDNIYNDKLNGILSEDDFIRIYESKKEEKENLLKRINEISSYINNNFINEDELTKKIIDKFLDSKKITREILTDLIKKIEIDQKKYIYIYFKFKSLND